MKTHKHKPATPTASPPCTLCQRFHIGACPISFIPSAGRACSCFLSFDEKANFVKVIENRMERSHRLIEEERLPFREKILLKQTKGK